MANTTNWWGGFLDMIDPALQPVPPTGETCLCAVADRVR